MELEKMLQKGLNFFHITHNEQTLKDLSFYARELKKWNEHMNLTGLKEMDSIVGELLYDALFLLGHTKGTKSVLDLGSGAGVLAIPVKILDGNLKVFSIDKSLKKIQFQRHIKRTMQLKNFVPLHGRAEDLEPMEADALIVKGFGRIEEIIEKGGRHIRRGGRAFIVKGKSEEPIWCPGFELIDAIPYVLPVNDRPYRLFIYRRF